MHVAVSKLFLLAALLGMLVRLALIWSRWIEGRLVSDDAYYYFTIASNMAGGGGSTFDGLSLTNGYHPLWLWLLVPIFSLFGDSLWLPVRLGLSLGCLFDLVSGLIIYRMIAVRGLKREAEVASFFWFLAPFTVLIGIRGMEASLSTMFVLGVVWSLCRLVDRDPQARDAVLVGGILGLAGLARTDNLVTVGMVVVVFTTWRYGYQFTPAVKWLSVVASCAFLVVLPWFVWNAHHFGSVLQVSGAVKLTPDIYGGLHTDWSSLKGALATVAYALLAPFLFTARYVTGADGGTGTWAFLVAPYLFGAVVVALALAVHRRFHPDPPFLRSFQLLSITYLTTHIVLFGIAWRNYINWYALPSMAFVCVWFGFSAIWLGDEGTQGKRLRVLLVTVSGVVFLALYPLRLSGLDQERERLETKNRERLQTLVARYPEGVRAGAYNAGKIGYEATHYDGITVVNLDGLVNNEAFRAYEADRYFDYVLDHVDVFLEDPETRFAFLTQQEADSLGKLYKPLNGQEIWPREGFDTD